MVELEPLKGGYYLWKYLPSVPAAVIFCLLFAGSTSLIVWRVWKTRTWFCIAFALGCFFQFVGYAARAAAHYRTGQIMPYVIQNLFILVAPALFAASIYMCLGRIIRLIDGEAHSIIRSTILTKIFVTGDVLSFVVQGGAAGLMVSGNNAKMGERIVIGGLLIQVLMFGLFAAVAVVFHVRMTRVPTPEACSASIPWESGLRMLYGVSALIMVRSVFRVIEYAMGHDGYPLRHEWTLYLFDAVLMFGVTVVFYRWYPNWVRPAKGERILAEEGFSMS